MLARLSKLLRKSKEPDVVWGTKLLLLLKGFMIKEKKKKSNFSTRIETRNRTSERGKSRSCKNRKIIDTLANGDF